MLLRRSGVDPSRIDGADQWVAFFLIVLLALALDAVLRFVLLRGVKRLVLRTRAKWDDVLFSDRVLRRMSHILTPMLIYCCPSPFRSSRRRCTSSCG